MWRTALMGVTAIVPMSALSGQEVRKGVNLSGELQAVSNPYLDQSQSNWVGSGTIEASPWLTTRSEAGRIELQGVVRLRGFTSIYDLEDSYAGSLRATHQTDERNAYHGSLSVSSSSARSTFARSLQSTGQPTGSPGFGPGSFPRNPAFPLPVFTLPDDSGAANLPGAPTIPVFGDPSLLGLAGRSTSLALDAGVDHRIDGRASISATLGYDRLWVSGAGGIGYQSASANLGYSKNLTGRTTVGASVSTTTTRYEDAYPRSTTVGLYGTASHQFDQRWTASASLGLNATHTGASILAPGGTQYGLAGEVTACRAGARDRLCIAAARSQQPSALGEVRTSNVVSLNYGAQLNERDRFDLSGNYSVSSGGDRSVAFTDDISAAGVGGTFTRRLGQRSEAYAFANTSRTYGGFLPSEPSITVGVGVRLKLGDSR